MADAEVIKRVGLDGETILDFKLPRGPKGEKGDQGDKGADGANVLPTDTAVANAINTNGTATKTALIAAIAGGGTFGGQTSYGYGNSWARGGQDGVPNYPQYASGLLGMTHVQHANNGFRMQDTTVNAFAPTTTLTGDMVARPWTVGTRAVVILGDLLNNLIEADDQRNRDTALEAGRAFLALMSAEARHEQNDAAVFTYSSGGWHNPNEARPLASGGTSTRGASSIPPGLQSAIWVDIKVPADRVCYLVVHGYATGAVGAEFVLTDNGQLVTTINTNAKSYTTDKRATGGYSQIVGRIPAGPARTIRATVANPGLTAQSMNWAVDCLLVESPTPNPVVVVKPLPVLAATHNKPDLLTYLRTIPDTLATEFSNVIVADPLPGWDPETYLLPDLLHCTADGIIHVGTSVAAAVKADLNRRTLWNLYGRTEEPLDEPVPGFVDSFDRTAGPLLTTENGRLWQWSNWYSSTLNGVNPQWQTDGAVAKQTAESGRSIAMADAHTPNMRVKATVGTVSTATGGVLVRAQDANNYIGVVLRISDADRRLMLVKRVANVQTSIGSAGAGQVSANGSVVELVADGDQISVYLDGVLAIGPVTETALNTVTLGGLMLQYDDHAATWASIEVTPA